MRVGPNTEDNGLVPWNQKYLGIVPWDWVVGEACSARQSECSFISKLYFSKDKPEDMEVPLKKEGVP